MIQQNAVSSAENCADPSDIADFFLDQALRAQRLAVSAYRNTPRDDGECVCGCGRKVNPARLALGYGLAIECAEVKGPKRR